MVEIVIKLADKEIALKTQFEDTASHFQRFIIENEKNKNRALSVDDALFDYWMKLHKNVDHHAEYSLFCYPISDYLLESNACIFHAVSFIMNNRAYLIAGPSGIGKTTHFLYLKKYSNKIAMISGDRPLLAFKDNSIFVYPTPWNGKENLCGNTSKELDGIIYLSRGVDSSLTLMNKREAVIPLFNQIFQSQSTQSIVNAASFLEKVLNRIPVWQLISSIPEESSSILFKMLTERQNNYEL